MTFVAQSFCEKYEIWVHFCFVFDFRNVNTFEVSLNGQDVLVDEGGTLREQGVVPGDTLHLIEATEGYMTPFVKK